MPGFILEYILDNILEISRTLDGTKDVVNEKRRFFMKAFRAAPAAMGRGTARPGNTTAEPPKTPEKRGIAGSTIMAVLIALVFIGIVTAAMVRNTGSQSSASVGYGTVQTMSSTVKSGIVATESYFYDNDIVQGKLLAKIDAYLNTGVKQFVVGDGDRKKEKLAADQHFTSQISVFDEVHQNPRYVGFEVNAGRSPSGKNLKKAFAYYNIDTGYNKITVDDDAKFQGTNAFSALGNARMLHGNAGTKIYGHAVFENGFLTQNGAPVEFLPDENDEGSVYIGQGNPPSPITIQNNSTPSALFKVNAFFDGDVNFQNGNPLFEKNVGFNGNITAPSRQAEFEGDVWFNGSFITQGSETKPTLIAMGTDQKFYYTSKIPMKTQATKCDALIAEGKSCPHSPSSHLADNNTYIQDATHNGFVNLHKDSVSGYLGSDIPNIQEKAGVLGNHVEPDIDMSVLTGKDEEKGQLGKEFIIASRDNVLNGSSQLTAESLQEFIHKTCGTPCVTPKPEFEKNYDKNGHLLVTIPPNGVSCEYKNGNEPDVFNGKVIFDVEGPFQVNTKFYSSGPDASTLVYVGKNGTLNNFGVGDGGKFSGLIYVDPENSKDNTFKWGNNTKCSGAVILKGGNLTWNNTAENYTTEIRRDNNVLKNYAFLTGPNNSGKKTTTVKHDTKGIKLSACGYYFY
jgi:hypothetical protein